MEPTTRELASLREALRQYFADAQETLRQADANAVVYDDSGWRVKDLVAHIAAWEEEKLRSLEAFERGGEYRIPGYTNDDAYNWAAYERTRDEPVDQIYAHWRALRQQVQAFVDRLEPAQYQAEVVYPWNSRGPVIGLLAFFVGHQNEHIAHIEARIRPNPERTRWMESLEETHRAAVRTLEGVDPNLVVHEESGWRVKDLVGHLVDWEVVVLRGLQAHHEGRLYLMPEPDFDRFNAAQAASRWDMPYDQVLGDWADVRAQLRELARNYTDCLLASEMTTPWESRWSVSRMFGFVMSHQDSHLEEIQARWDGRSAE